MDEQERRDKNTKIIALRVLKHGKRSTSNSCPAPGLQCGDQLQPMLSDEMSPDIATRARARNTRFCSCDLEYNISNGQLSDVTGSAHIMGRYLANAEEEK